MATAAEAGLLAAAALHAGFQLTVTLVVYPALARPPAAGPPDGGWEAAHAAHRRAITPVVVMVYAAVVAGVAGTLLAGDPTVAGVVGAAGLALSLGVTATVAGPAHGRLAGGRDERLLRRLLVADRVRCAGAVVGLVGALAAVL